MTAGEPRAASLVSYMFGVLDALNIRNGPGHGEVKWGADGVPCLVEVGSRCHGAEGMWIPIADEVYGYNQVSATLDAYVDAGAYEDDGKYPVAPAVRRGYGCAKMLISHVRGEFEGFNAKALAEVKAMKR